MEILASNFIKYRIIPKCYSGIIFYLIPHMNLFLRNFKNVYDTLFYHFKCFIHDFTPNIFREFFRHFLLLIRPNNYQNVILKFSSKFNQVLISRFNSNFFQHFLNSNDDSYVRALCLKYFSYFRR